MTGDGGGGGKERRVRMMREGEQFNENISLSVMNRH